MGLAIINKGYKPNLAIDMVTAALQHYKKWERPVEDIVLSPKMWDMFTRGMVERFPDKEEDIKHFNECHFHNCVIKKGSTFMVKPMDVTLKERVLA